jgi:hypothetical protein
LGSGFGFGSGLNACPILGFCGFGFGAGPVALFFFESEVRFLVDPDFF